MARLPDPDRLLHGRHRDRCDGPPVDRHQRGLLPHGARPAGMDHRARLHLGEPGRHRDPGDGRERRAVRPLDGPLLLDRRRPGDGVPRAVHDALLLLLPLHHVPGVHGPPLHPPRGHSVPEFMPRRFNRPAHLVNGISFAVAQLLTAGVNLFALSIVIEALLGWPRWVAMVFSAFIVLAYLPLGGLSGPVYNEVMEFFVIIAGRVPVVVIGLVKVGGWSG